MLNNQNLLCPFIINVMCYDAKDWPVIMTCFGHNYLFLNTILWTWRKSNKVMYLRTLVLLIRTCHIETNDHFPGGLRFIERLKLIK